MSNRKHTRDPPHLFSKLPTDNYAQFRSADQYSTSSKKRQILDANPVKHEADSSIDSSTNTVASLNRSYDSGFFQEGTSGLLASSFHFDNLSSKNRSRADIDERSKTWGIASGGQRFESIQDFERPKSMSNFEKWSPKNQCLQNADLAFTKQPIHSHSSKIGQFLSGAEIFPHSDKLEIGIQTNPSISTSFSRRTSGKPSANQVFGNIAENFIYQNGALTGLTDNCNSGEDDSIIRGAQRQEGGLHHHIPITIKKLPSKTDGLDYSKKITSRVVHAPVNANYDDEADISEEEGPTVNQSPKEEFSISIEKDKSKHLRNNGRTRALQTSETDFPNNSKTVNDDLKASSKSSILQESLFDMFGAKLSDVCRQLLLSDCASQVDSSRTDMLHDCGKAEKPENTASQSVSSLPLQSSNVGSKGFQRDSVVVIDHVDNSRTSDERMRSKHPANNSTSLDNLTMKSTAPEFSLKVDRQPIWSMAPAPPGIPENESSKKGDQVPLYCKFVRQVSKDDANHVKSIEGKNIRSKQTIDCEENTVTDTAQSDGLGSMTNKEPQKRMNECIVNNNSNLDDAKLLIETKQTSTFESGRRSQSAKTYKTSKRFPRSPRERSVSRRRREYLHEISLEIIKTIEEELRISHRWNGVSPSETIARRLDRILSTHHRDRVSLGLTEPLNQEQYNLLIDRIALQDRDYFSHRSPRALPYRSLSPPPLVENLLREDQGFSLEKRLALLLRCGQMESGGSVGRDFREDYDFSRAMETNASLQLPRLHLEDSSSTDYQPTLCNLPAQRPDSKSRLVDRVSKSFPISTKNETFGDCLEATPKTLKKINVMQTKIPLNDKVLEIVLNVSEHESNRSSNVNLPNEPTPELSKEDFPDCPTASEGESKPFRDGNNMIDLPSNAMVTNKSEHPDMKKEHSESSISYFQKDLVVVVTELEEARPSIEFKVLEPSSNANSEILKPKSCEENVEIGGRSVDLDELKSKDDLVEYEEQTNSISNELSDNDAAFEAEISPQSVSPSNKSYFSLDLGNKFKNVPRRRIKIMLSSSSDAGDNCSIVAQRNHPISENKLESLGQEECILSGGNLSDNNNMKTSRQTLSSSDDVIFGAGSGKKNENNAQKLDQMKIRKRVTFNRDLVISPSDSTGVRKFSSDKTILVNKDYHPSPTSLETKGKTNELKESSDSLNPNQVILVNKFLDFSGNGPKETSIFQTHPQRQDNSNSISSTDLSRSTDVVLGIPMSLKLRTSNLRKTDEKTYAEANESLDSLQLMMSGGEPSEIDPGLTIQKISVTRASVSTPSPPRLLRKLNAVRVTDFGAARGILRKAFKDRAFGKAFDDSDVAVLSSKSSFGVSKRKQRRTRNEVPEKERILANVEVQTELDVANKETLNITRSSLFSQSWLRESSFLFLAKLGELFFSNVLLYNFS